MQNDKIQNRKITKIRGSADFHRRLASLGLYLGNSIDLELVSLRQEPARFRVNEDGIELSQVRSAPLE